MTTQTAQKPPTAKEKYEARWAEFARAEGVQFATPEAERNYRAHVLMFKDAVELRKPARVPVCPNIGFYPFAYAGVTAEQAMYDYDKLAFALQKYHADFLPDSLAGAPLYGCGRALDILDYKLYRWPGRGVPPEAPYQCVEAEYMKADEYDALIADPSGYFMRSYLPRIFGALEAWKMTAPPTDVQELPFFGPYIVPMGIPPVQESFMKLLEAGRVAMEWIQAAGAADAGTITKLGIPSIYGGFTKAPFDSLGDTLRGTRAMMLDLYRQPRKVVEACERLTPIAIDLGLRAIATAKHPVAFIPLHKGADGFMSDDNFKTFYWPTLKAVILGLIEQGCVPYLFVEGGHNHRLDVIADSGIPAGKTIWMFDQTDMKAVKKKFGSWACFGATSASRCSRRARRRTCATASGGRSTNAPRTAGSSCRPGPWSTMPARRTCMP
jgi:hypothetical protein